MAGVPTAGEDGADTPPVTDAGFARWLADRAGRALCGLRSEVGFADPVLLRKLGDARAHELIAGLITRWRPGDALLSEEGVRDDANRATANRVWIVDPLDGTREFGEPDRSDWAVHVALWRRDGAGGTAGAGAGRGELVAGAVALPALGQTLGTDSPPGFPVMRDAGGVPPLRLAASRTRPPALLDRVRRAWPEVELVPMGSVGRKVAAVIFGEVDAYVHAGGQYEWDSAAPVAVARATGLYASRIDGSALEYNRPDPSLPDIVVCRKHVAPRLVAALAQSA
jgi:3'(2'), 5'-bisphosphate nucleotidase